MTDDMWGGVNVTPAREEDTAKFRQAAGGRPAVAPPRRIGPALAPAPTGVRHRGQLRMAERFMYEHGAKLRFVHGIGWHVWDDARWKEDDERADLNYAVETVKTAVREAMQMDPSDRDDFLKDIRKAENASGLEGIAKIASARFPMSTSSRMLDADPEHFNTPEGTIHLGESLVYPHDRDHLITKVSGGVIVSEEQTEKWEKFKKQNEEWEKFIERILPDKDVREFVQRLIGYSMLGEVREHVMPIFTGTGANGKGTLRDALVAAFGDYAYEADPQLLMESKNERHGTFKMQLRGRRLVFCSETDRDRRFAEATMKRLVGGDPIEANLMHKNPITFLPSHTLIMMTNHLPKVSGDDPAVWRRILVVPFDVVIPENERDPGLPGRLKSATSAVLSWAYDGWVSYLEKGLAPPEVVRARTADYQSRSDVLARFLDDRTIESPHGVVKARDLYAAWVSWCHATGETAVSEVAFAASMEARGFEKKRSAAGQQYRGLMLQQDDDEDQDDEEDGWPAGARRTPPAPPAEPRQEEIPGA